MKYFTIKKMHIWVVLLCSVFFLVDNLNAQEKIETLEKQLMGAGQEKRVDILLTLSKEYWNIAPVKGLDYSNQAAQLALTLEDKPKEAKALLYSGVNAWFAGSYDIAIGYYQKSLRIAESIDDKRLIAYNLNNLGMVSSHLENYDKAIDYYTKSSLIMKALEDDIEYAKIINNIGKLNALQEDFQTALANQLSIVELVERSKERTFYLWLLCDIGTLYRKLEDDEMARHYFSKALDLSRSIDDKVGKAMILRNLGMILFAHGEYDQAKNYLNESLQLALKSAAKEEIRENYKSLSEYYQAVGKYQKALEKFQWYKAFSDSLLNESKMNAIIEMETKYATENKEKENRLLRKNNEIKRLQIQKQTYLRDFFIALLVISIFITVIVYKQFRTKRSLNTALNEKNALLEKTVHERTEALKVNELLVKEMNHRVKNNLSVIQSLLNLQSHKMSDLESKTILRDSATRVTAISRMHAILTGKVNLRAIQIDHYVNQLMNDLADNFNIDRSRVEIVMNLERVTLDVNVMVPFVLILNELVTNVFKYAFREKENGILEVILKTAKANRLELIVKDNGSGMPRGFSIENTESFGMEIVTSLVEQIGGTLTFNTKDNEGTEFRVSFPNQV